MATRNAQLVHTETEYQVVDLSVNQTVIVNAPAILMGIYVNTVLSTHAVVISDGSTSVFTLIADLAAGQNLDFQSTRFDETLVINPNVSSTGNITVSFRKVNTD